MRILGIDPGSRKSGFGLVDKKSGELKYVHSETVCFDVKKDFLGRVPSIFEETKRILNEYKPDVVAIESLIYVKSPTALIKLAQTRGVILAAICESGLSDKVFEYSPNLIKSQTVGHGHADKQAGQKFLYQYFGMTDFSTDDESDALLVALCHSFSEHRDRVKSKSKGGSLADALAHKI